MKMIDLSHPFSNALREYPGDPETEIRFFAHEGFQVGYLKASLHTGTHIDAPCHALGLGSSIDDMPLEWMISQAFVWQANIVNHVIQTDHFLAEYQQHGMNAKTLLVATGHDLMWNTTDYFQDVPMFDEKWVEVMKQLGIRMIGIDAPTFSSSHASDLVFHQHLFEAGIYLVENLTRLDQLPTEVEFLCFPLKIIQGDASWVRACARFQSNHA